MPESLRSRLLRQAGLPHKAARVLDTLLPAKPTREFAAVKLTMGAEQKVRFDPTYTGGGGSNWIGDGAFVDLPHTIAAYAGYANVDVVLPSSYQGRLAAVTLQPRFLASGAGAGKWVQFGVDAVMGGFGYVACGRVMGADGSTHFAPESTAVGRFVSYGPPRIRISPFNAFQGSDPSLSLAGVEGYLFIEMLD